MKCKNHADIDAAARCTGCQEAFCENCLVEMDGKKYCGDCKIMAVREKPEIEFESDKPETKKSERVCKQSRTALIFGIFSIFIPIIGATLAPIFIPIIGIIMGLTANFIATNAKKRIKENPNLRGGVMASVSSILGAGMFAIWASILLLIIIGTMLN